jgi:hypothetical protein
MSGINPDVFITETMPALIREKLPSAKFINYSRGNLHYTVELYDGIVFSFIRREYTSTVYQSVYTYVFSFTQDGMCFHESYSNETLALAGLDEFLTTKPKLPTWVFDELASNMGQRGYTIDLTSRRLGTFTFRVKHSQSALSRNLIVHRYMGKWNIEISKTLDVGVGAPNIGSIMSALQDTATATTLQGRVSGDINIDTCHVLNRLTTLFVQ